MASIKQKRALDKIIENRGNVSKSMVQVGYTPATAKNPKNLTESKGFIELCTELGLTDTFLTEALIEDIKAKPQNRKPELELGFKVLNRLRDNDEKGNTTNVYINNLRVEQQRRLANEILDATETGTGETD